MAYAVGHMSGGHFYPAVTLGLVSAGRFRATDAIGYVIVQVLGAVAAAGVLAFIARGTPGFVMVTSGLASNGYGAHSPGGYSLGAALVTEFVMTSFPIRYQYRTTQIMTPLDFRITDLSVQSEFK